MILYSCYLAGRLMCAVREINFNVNLFFLSWLFTNLIIYFITFAAFSFPLC
uniref:Uncharacterized protein n=1 Tax=Manihot esculenta TaxID=3983 RepID=A0A2C9WP60_MANES